jgi:hypothetical protein
MKDIDADIEAHIDASHGFVQNDQKVTKDNIGKLIRGSKILARVFKITLLLT